MLQPVFVGPTHEAPNTRSRAMRSLSKLLLLAMHLCVFFALVVHVTWGLVALAAGGYVVRMWAITAGYHRYLTHRSFKTTRAFQFLLALLGTTAMQNGPLWWASWHRRHHRFSDTPHDMHSPVQGGFWHAHIGWILSGEWDDRDLSNVRDLVRYPELRFLDNHEWMPLVAYALICFVIAGLPGVVWGFVVSTLAVFHATMLINSLGHVWGTRRYVTTDASRNNALLALLTFGEGWHNNHHHVMTSARQGFFWWEIDLTYYSLLVLAALGIIWDLREPSAGQLAAPRMRDHTVVEAISPPLGHKAPRAGSLRAT